MINIVFVTLRSFLAGPPFEKMEKADFGIHLFLLWASKTCLVRLTPYPNLEQPIRIHVTWDVSATLTRQWHRALRTTPLPTITALHVTRTVTVRVGADGWTLAVETLETGRNPTVVPHPLFIATAQEHHLNTMGIIEGKAWVGEGTHSQDLNWTFPTDSMDGR